MKISIITVCFNSQQTIKATINSVLNQSYSKVEYIIIDGGSTDNTIKIITEFSNSIDVFVSESDAGIYDAINKGINNSSGDVVGLLHADDVFDNNSVLENVMNFFEQDIDMIYGDINYVDRNDINRVIRRWKSNIYTKGKFKWGWMPPHTGFFIKKYCYLKHGLYNLNLGSSADYELMLRMFELYNLKSKYIPLNITKMRVGGVSNSSFKNRWEANRNDKRSWKINGLKPFWFAFLIKPIIKIKQFF
jgi:glycosyltransferase involved in cell wall biosynthesis|tara:strand:+ start:8071 stop:8811 length:741 start_codon:yes stop_codon:yes gene_type:complete